MRWRKSERARLIKERLEISADTRNRNSDCIAEQLDTTIDDLSGRVVSAYRPMRGEPDLRAWLERVASRGGRYALPVVVEKQAPLVFRTWRRGERLERGVWNIPVPVTGEEVCPDVVIAPVVGYDRDAYTWLRWRIFRQDTRCHPEAAADHRRGIQPSRNPDDLPAAA
ncbi:MAG: 5-formyltetrahydrofolate cyclo-ligase [Methyloceanibacter sp.]